MALSIWVAVSANWPEYGMIRPILTVCCAAAGATISAANRPAISVLRIEEIPPRIFVLVGANLSHDCARGRILVPAAILGTLVGRGPTRTCGACPIVQREKRTESCAIGSSR